MTSAGQRFISVLMLIVQLLLHGGRTSSFQRSLKVRRLRPGAGAGNEEVAAILEMEHHQTRVVGPKTFDSLVCRQLAPLGAARWSEIECNPAEQSLMVFKMITQERFIGLVSRSRQVAGRDGLWIYTLAAG